MNESTGAASAAPTLTELADQIHVEMAAIERSDSSALAHAIRAGELLTQAKGRLTHGKWIPWMKENFPSDVRTGQRYMLLAANATHVSHLGSVREALSVVSPPKSGPRPKLKLKLAPADAIDRLRKRVKQIRGERNRWGHLPRWTWDDVALVESVLTAKRQGGGSGKRLRGLYEQRRAEDNLLIQARIDIEKLVGHLEIIDFPMYGIRNADQDTIADVYRDLTRLSVWLGTAMPVVAGEVTTLKKRELLRKMRNVNGRPPEEAKLYLEAADILEAELLGISA